MKMKRYSIKFTFNGKTLSKRSVDIGQTIQEIKPEVLHTEMYVSVKDGDNKVERRLNLQQARRVFQDDIMRQIFVSNLLLQ